MFFKFHVINWSTELVRRVLSIDSFGWILSPKLWFQLRNFDVECPKDKVPHGLTSILNPKPRKHANLWQTLTLNHANLWQTLNVTNPASVDVFNPCVRIEWSFKQNKICCFLEKEKGCEEEEDGGRDRGECAAGGGLGDDRCTRGRRK